MNVLLDTCVVIDVLEGREPFRSDGEELFRLVATDKIEGFLTANSITDIYYHINKATHSNEKTREIISKLLSLFHVIDTTAEDCMNALVSNVNDYEDAVLIEAAKRTRMNCIITRNIRDFSKSEIPFFSPDDFLNIYKDNK